MSNNFYYNLIKKLIIFLLILISLFLILEVFQRCRYAYRDNSFEPLYYGFRDSPRLIRIKKSIMSSFFRQPFTILEKDKGKNILFIGGSGVYGAYNDDFHTFPYLLQAKINGISCLNAGKPSIASDQYLNILQRCFKEFCIPDMVIFYTGYNDMFLTVLQLENKMIIKIIQYSFLALTIREKIMFEDFKKKKALDYRINFDKEFEKNIENCIKYAQTKDIDVVLIPEILLPPEVSPFRRYIEAYYSKVPKALNRLAQKYNCYFLDAKDILYTDWKENFVDILHITDKGNELLSTFLAHNLSFGKK